MVRAPLSFGVKVVAVAAYFVLWWAAYGYVNAYGVASPRAVAFTPPREAVPGLLQPWTAVIYLFGGLALPLLPFYYHWTRPRLALVLVAYAVTSCLAFACYMLWPMTIVRSSYEGPGVGLWLMREVVAVDGAANCTPSSHVFYAVLAGLLVGRRAERRATRVAVWVMVVAVCVTTITTGQHYFIDIPGGVVAALVGYFTAVVVVPGGAYLGDSQPR